MIDRRESSRRGRAEALEAVQWRAAPWRPWADLALRQAASMWSDLTSDEVWYVLDAHRIPHPSEPRAMGPVMLAGVRRRWLVPTDRFRVADNPATSRNHGRPQRVYESRIYGADLPVWPDVQRPVQATLFEEIAP